MQTPYQTWFAKTFSYSMSYGFTFFLWYCFFNSRNYCIIQVCEYLLWFFSKKFIVIYLTYRSLILFKWIFFIWCEIQVQIHSYACECPVVSIPFVENTILRTEFFGITVLLIWTWMNTYISGLKYAPCFTGLAYVIITLAWLV